MSSIFSNQKDGLSEDGTLFYLDGLCYLPFPNKETMDYWVKMYDDKYTNDYARQIIKGRAECTVKYFAQREEKELLYILNKTMERWWK